MVRQRPGLKSSHPGRTPPGPLAILRQWLRTMLEPDLPCLRCEDLQAQRARREIAEVYLAARQGRLPPRSTLPGPLLPASCCRRLREVSIDAMVG